MVAFTTTTTAASSPAFILSINHFFKPLIIMAMCE
jgi:hypothetical protein